MSQPEPALQITSMTKRYRRLVAVDSMDLVVEAGEFVGFIGPNGAGKSSTMGCIAGVIAPDEGTVEIQGIDVSTSPVEARKRLGFVPQHLTLLDYLTGLEYLHFVADLRELSTEERDAEIDELLVITELEGARDTIIREYSGGMIRKMALAAALLGKPPLLVLDESFVGLDPESTYRLRRRLEEHCKSGGSIILSSHILDMLEPLCDRYVIINQGKIVGDYNRQELAKMKEDGQVENLTELYLEVTGKATTLTSPRRSTTA